MRGLAVAVVCAGLVAAGCSSAPVEPALSPDEQFFAGLDERSVFYVPPAQFLVDLGNAMCEAGRQGTPIATILVAGRGLYSEADLRSIAASAVPAYCPDVEIAGL